MVVGELIYETDVLVLGGGPGGYTAAIRAADLGRDVMLVEARENLGGVCLTEGCIPSKTLIHAVELVEDLASAEKMGITAEQVSVDPERLRTHMADVVAGLSGGVSKLLDNRDVDVLHGHARFLDQERVYVDGANTIIRFKHVIIATGSRINETPDSWKAQVWSSAQALELPEIPKEFLVIGGGYIGLEIGQAYAGLGSRVTLVEFQPELLSGADPDLVKLVTRKCKKQFQDIHLDSKVLEVEETDQGYRVVIQTPKKTIESTFNRVLAATGRRPNTDNLDLDKLGIELDDRGLIPTDETCRTRNPKVFAIGDVTPGPALAHKAAREGKVAAEIIAGEPSAFDNVTVPAVLFTSPQIAWTGLTETEARQQERRVKIGKFPLTALGRAKASNKTEGFVKVIVDAESQVILGVGMVGAHASELISEGTLAIEMGACLEDLIVSIHPHPTFSESLMEAAEMAAGGSVHFFKS